MNTDICSIIASYIIEEKYEILEWINKKRLHIHLLPLNKNAVYYLEKDHINYIDWSKLSGNKKAGIIPLTIPPDAPPPPPATLPAL